MHILVTCSSLHIRCTGELCRKGSHHKRCVDTILQTMQKRRGKTQTQKLSEDESCCQIEMIDLEPIGDDGHLHVKLQFVS